MNLALGQRLSAGEDVISGCARTFFLARSFSRFWASPECGNPPRNYRCVFVACTSIEGGASKQSVTLIIGSKTAKIKKNPIEREKKPQAHLIAIDNSAVHCVDSRLIIECNTSYLLRISFFHEAPSSISGWEKKPIKLCH